MKHAQLVVGPAGSGKSTYCHTIVQHCEAARRVVHVVNLDPAAEDIRYSPSIDVRELISLEDVMQELDYGPNGGLVYCMEYLVSNMDWLEDKVADYNDDYLLLDCPGQVELYSHLPYMRRIVDELRRWGYNTCAVYLIDSVSISDASRFIAGTLTCLSAMVQLELPHINVLTKVDLLENKEDIDRYVDPDMTDLMEELSEEMTEKYRKLNMAIGRLIDDYAMVNFLPLDISDEESIALVLSHVDNAIQYGEDLEVKDHERDEEMHDNEDADEMGDMNAWGSMEDS